MDLEVSDRRLADGRTVLDVAGEIDVYSGAVLRQHIMDVVADQRYELVADLRGVTFMDSTGLGILVGGLKAVRARGGSMELVCTSGPLLRIFRLTGMDKVFRIHLDVLVAPIETLATSGDGARGARRWAVARRP